MPLMMPLASHDADANSTTWPKTSCSSPVGHCDVTEGMVPLMTLLRGCDSDAAASCIMTKRSYSTHCFNHLDLMNIMVPLRIPLVSHNADASANSAKWLMRSCCILFLASWTNKAVVLLMLLSLSCDAILGITWPKKVMFHLVSVILT